jgi:hypothetical protein
MDRLNNNVFFQKPFFREALTVWWTDSTTMLFFRNLFFHRRGKCDGHTQQQCYFSETFFSQARKVWRTDSTTMLFFRNLFLVALTVWRTDSTTMLFFRNLYFLRGSNGVTDRLNNNVIFQKPFFSQARKVWRTDSTTMLFFRNLFSRGSNGVTDRLNNNVIFQKPFFHRRGKCDGQTQQQCYFSETFFLVALTVWRTDSTRMLFFRNLFSRGCNGGADGVLDRLNNNVIFQKPLFFAWL